MCNKYYSPSVQLFLKGRVWGDSLSTSSAEFSTLWSTSSQLVESLCSFSILLTWTPRLNMASIVLGSLAYLLLNEIETSGGRSFLSFSSAL